MLDLGARQARRGQRVIQGRRGQKGTQAQQAQRVQRVTQARQAHRGRLGRLVKQARREQRSSVGPPGPTAVSANANNQAKLGTDSLLYVAPPPIYPAFSVYQANTQAIVKNVATKILFDTKEFDTTNAFNIANARFNPKIAGYYEVNCGCGLNAGSVTVYASIYKNGAEYRRSTTTTSANARLSTLVQLNGTTDYLEGYVYCTANFSTVTGSVLTSFSGALSQPASGGTSGSERRGK